MQNNAQIGPALPSSAADYQKYIVNKPQYAPTPNVQQQEYIPRPRQLAIPKQCTNILQAHKGPINCVRFTRNSEYCLSGGSDKLIRLFNPHKGIFIKDYTGHGYDVLDVDIVHDNSKFASAGLDKAIYLWDIGQAQIIRKLRDHTGRVNSIMFSQDCDIMVSGGYDKTVKCWDMKGRSFLPIQTMDHATDSIMSVFIHKEIILTASVDGCIRIYDIRKGNMTIDNMGQACTDIKCTADGKCISVSCLDGKIRLIDTVSGDLLNVYTGHVNSSYKIGHALGFDDNTIWSGSEDGTLFGWDLLEPKNQFKLQGHTKAVSCVSHHKEKSIIASGSFDGTVRIWGP